MPDLCASAGPEIGEAFRERGSDFTGRGRRVVANTAGAAREAKKREAKLV